MFLVVQLLLLFTLDLQRFSSVPNVGHCFSTLPSVTSVTSRLAWGREATEITQRMRVEMTFDEELVKLTEAT